MPIRRCDHRALLGVVVAATLVLAACDDGGPPDVDPPPAPEDDGEPEDELTLAPPCAEVEARDYVPPPEEQPEPDPTLTTTEPLPDDLIDPPDDTDDDLDADDDLAVDDDGTVRPPDQPPLDPMSAARQWAEDEAHDDFAGMWIDSESGTPVIAFTEDVEAYAEQVRDQFGEGWWVVELEHSYAELRAVQDQIVRDEIPPPDDPEDDGPEDDVDEGEAEDLGNPVNNVGFRDPLNRLILRIDGPTEERIAQLSERYGAEFLCWEDRAPEVEVPTNGATEPDDTDEDLDDAEDDGR